MIFFRILTKARIHVFWNHVVPCHRYCPTDFRNASLLGTFLKKKNKVLRVFQDIYQSWNSNILKSHSSLSQLEFFCLQKCIVAKYISPIQIIYVGLRVFKEYLSVFELEYFKIQLFPVSYCSLCSNNVLFL